MSYQNDFSERVDNIGNLKISEDVVAAITRIAAKEIEGVAELAVAPSSIKGLFKSKPVKSAVSVDLNDGVAVIDVYLKIKYGAKVQAVAVKNGKAKKIIVYKYKPKKGYHKKQGHRQPYTKLEIKKIEA